MEAVVPVLFAVVLSAQLYALRHNIKNRQSKAADAVHPNHPWGMEYTCICISVCKPTLYADAVLYLSQRKIGLPSTVFFHSHFKNSTNMDACCWLILSWAVEQSELSSPQWSGRLTVPKPCPWPPELGVPCAQPQNPGMGWLFVCPWMSTWALLTFRFAFPFAQAFACGYVGGSTQMVNSLNSFFSGHWRFPGRKGRWRVWRVCH